MSQHKTSADEWDRRFYALAGEVATWSKDPDKKVGAVIVSADRRQLSIGYNGFVRGADDDITNTADKLALTVHAELNAILNAGVPVRHCTMYATKFPCMPCAKALVQAGITRLYAGNWRRESKWADEHGAALRLLITSGVAVTFHQEVYGSNLPTATKLEALADWLDFNKLPDEGNEVQHDLRRWASQIRAGDFYEPRIHTE